MRFTLTDYQLVAADETLRALRRAARDYADDGDYAAVSLSAPTAAGKTVIATAVIERLFYGDDTTAPDDDASVLWITDDPSLNEQTRRKMLIASSALHASQLRTVDAAFDQETFDRHVVYFLNIQKLGRATSYVHGGVDGRTYSLWTTIANSIKDRGGRFLAIIDEAHRGARTDQARPTIVSRIISDPDGVVPPTPVVWGISATPERFQAAMDRASTPSRVVRQIRVRSEDVRESGLLKDTILIRHPAETQPSVATLTRLAVEDIARYDEEWSGYSRDEDEAPVNPVLAVQLQPSISEGDLAELLNTLKESWPVLAHPRAIAHSMQSHMALTAGPHTVPYIEPQDVQDDPEVRVVLFKEALTTGWDCPRAEVMLSFRRAAEYTYIAQLIGRMVRTPLAKRIPTSDVLNTVSLLLPHYHDEHVGSVVDRLRQDPDAPPLAVERNPVECPRSASVDAAVFELLASLPSYVVPGRAYRSQVARLHTLAARLVGDGIDESAITAADEHLIGSISAERDRLSVDGRFDRLMTSLGEIAYETRRVALQTGDDTSEISTTSAETRDIDSLFKAAGRGFRDGLASTYWGRLVEGGADATDAKLAVAALASNADVVSAVEGAAEVLVQTWLRQHSRAIADLPEARKAAYYAVRAQARESELSDIVLPPSIIASADDPPWDRHIYANGPGAFPARFTSWEEQVLRIELHPDRRMVAWYRNPVGGRRTLRVPYRDGDYDRPMYPDLVLFHDTPDGLRPSIVDPHNYALGDAIPKLRGLVEYAERHGEQFARIDSVIKTQEDRLLRLDLKDPTVRSAVRDAGGTDQLLTVYREHGGDYV